MGEVSWGSPKCPSSRRPAGVPSAELAAHVHEIHDRFLDGRETVYFGHSRQRRVPSAAWERGRTPTDDPGKYQVTRGLSPHYEARHTRGRSTPRLDKRPAGGA